MNTYNVLVECITNGSKGVLEFEGTSIEEVALKAIRELKGTVYRVIEVSAKEEGGK